VSGCSSVRGNGADARAGGVRLANSSRGKVRFIVMAIPGNILDG
jgi:hypothetical protein